MSKKTKPRRGPVPGRAASRRAADLEQVAEGVKERMLSGLWAAITAGDPMRAELEAAICLGLPRIAKMEPDEAENFVSNVLVREAVRRRSPDSAAMLRLLAALGPASVKRTASRALAELTKDGIYPPEWVTEAGRAVPVQAWRRYDVFGDSEAVAVTFRYGEVEHVIFADIDLISFPVAVAVGVAADSAGLLDAIKREEDPLDRAEQIGLAAARGRLESPLALCDQEPDPSLTTETIAALPIARSRVRRLPPEGASSTPVFTAADRSAAVDDFMKSPLAAEVVAADEQSTRFWAEVLTGYSSRVPGEAPGQVGPRKLQYILLRHVPDTFVLSPAQRQHLAPAVTAWARWSAGYRGLDEAAVARLTEGLPEVFGQFDSAYEDQIAVASRAYVSDLASSDVDLAWLRGHLARRMYALPRPVSADGQALMDVSDRGDRRALVRDEFADCTPPGGMTGEQFVTAADRIVDELWSGDPPGTFAEVKRLAGEGFDRHEAVHRLAAGRT